MRKYSLKELLLVEYSEKIFQELIKRYKLQNRNLDDEVIRAYITRFDQLKGSIKQRLDRQDMAIVNAVPKELQVGTKFLDILQWKRFADLEKVIDIFPAPPSAAKAALQSTPENDAETDADKIYDKDGLEIYQGNSQGKCVKYGHTMGNSYSWCISYTTPQNMYSSYRFMNEDSRMFYFVFDRTRSSRKDGGGFEDKYHAVVIHAFEDGRYGFSNASNAGDQKVRNWDDLGTYMPADLWKKIKPLKSLFKFIPPSSEEVKLAAIKGKTFTTEQFAALDYETKLLYINTGNKLSRGQLDTLDTDLKNQYINLGNPCPFEVIKENIPLVRRYIKIQFERKNKAVSPEYLPYLDKEDKRKYYEKYKDDAFLLPEHIVQYFPEYLENYLDDMVIQNKYYVPDELIRYMTPAQKVEYNSYGAWFADKNILPSPSEENFITEYYISSQNITHEHFMEIPSQQKAIMENWLIKKIISKEIDSTENPNYEMLKLSLPSKYEVKKNGILYYFDDIKKWVDGSGRSVELHEDWTKYSLQKRAGLIK